MVCGLKHSDFRRFSRAMCRVAMAMCSASAVISDCESVQSRYSLCNQRPRGTHSHPGQWKSELKQFLLKYSEIPRSSCACKACERSIRRGLHGKFKGEFGLNKTPKKKRNVTVYKVVAKRLNLVVLILQMSV